jgi:hypothetical protein
MFASENQSEREAIGSHSAMTSRPTAFWNIVIGGVGTQAGQRILSRYRTDSEPFPMTLFHWDTDPSTSLDTEDHALIQLTGTDVHAMEANPGRFGPEANDIIRELKRMLGAGDIMNGSRTTRALTQLAVIFHVNQLCRAMRKSLTRLRERFKVSIVQPVLISSSGGGTGSAGQILLMDLMRQAAFRHRLLKGIPTDLLLPPMAFVAEPFAFANETSHLQSRKITANCLAYRLESEYLLQQRAASYVGHIGYANDGGTILADPDLMAKVLGNSVYELERCWPVIKARWVDSADEMASMAHYAGVDSPEFDHSDDEWTVRRDSL